MFTKYNKEEDAKEEAEEEEEEDPWFVKEDHKHTSNRTEFKAGDDFFRS